MIEAKKNTVLKFKPLLNIQKFKPNEITKDYENLKYTIKFLIYNYTGKDSFNSTIRNLAQLFNVTDRRVKQKLNIKTSDLEVMTDEELDKCANYFGISKNKLFTPRGERA